MYYSYAMGMPNDIFRLESLGFGIEEGDGDYMLSFDEKLIPIWEEYVTKHLKNGYWNEYIGDKIVFIFKFNDGSVKKYLLCEQNHDEILKLCCEFAGTTFVSVKDMILGNSFYKENVEL